MFEREYKQTLKKRIEDEPRRFIQVLYGPRQVGKTTLVTQFIEQTKLPCHYVSADAIIAPKSGWISQQWETARIKLKHSGSSEAVLIIDEIQTIDHWSEFVKKEWDSDTKNHILLKVILLGSSRLLIQHGLAESLAGRFESINIGHWSFSEMKGAFGFLPEQFVWYGGYPGAAGLITDEARWKQYISDSLIEATMSKDILMLTRVDKPALLKRLFELGCDYSGQILSYNKVMGQLQDAGNTTTLAHYLDLLHTAGLLTGIEKFSPNKIRQRSSSPKFQVHNTALITAMQPYTLNEIKLRPDRWGRWVESAIGAHLLNQSISGGFELFYWRERNDEVDFVILLHNRLIGLEVKSGSKQRVSGIDAFQKKFNPEKILLIGDTGIPWQDFLMMNIKDIVSDILTSWTKIRVISGIA